MAVCLLALPNAALFAQEPDQEDTGAIPGLPSLEGLTLPTETEASATELVDPVEAAINLIREGKRRKGMDALRTLGEQGNPEGYYHLAEIYRLGAGRDARVSVATMFYRLAANLDHDRSALALANMLFFENEATPETREEAVAIWKKYALSGNLEAMYVLGTLYWNGDAGLTQDPIRGYGLVWRASNEGYNDAIETELAMSTQLNFEARRTGREYAEKLEDNGLGEEQLAFHLVSGDAEDEARESGRVKPENWADVWRIEVGYGLKKPEAEKLLEDLRNTKGDYVNDLFIEFVESSSRTGTYHLMFGPLKGLQESVMRCVHIKQSGHDCFAQPPG